MLLGQDLEEPMAYVWCYWVFFTREKSKGQGWGVGASLITGIIVYMLIGIQAGVGRDLTVARLVERPPTVKQTVRENKSQCCSVALISTVMLSLGFYSQS